MKVYKTLDTRILYLLWEYMVKRTQNKPPFDLAE